ncbi:3-hydroxyacyl-CoA dehydrogenase family protein [Halosquirtibacter laminarini]|uniref:3-hydroxyacyl-CoA dehydrogenase family protein n=1 Tax=Halosquirtibacter laminarini TaxID=3374600 RepID=A0AC61NP94_9BACT|nr:3-hydroxyacyl-CoA dehydrogenase family protein [Prolixibacteraceae bacterium]
MTKIVEQIEDFGLSKKHRSKTLFSKIGIVGCGKVGQNIARIAAFNGIEVVFIEVSLEKISEAKTSIENELDKRIDNWGLTPGEKKAILSRICGSTDYSDLAECDFVIEAIREQSEGLRIETRKDVFKEIEAKVSKECIIATNSTTIAITELASELEYKERCVSLHFFIQSAEAKVCEVVKSLYTTERVYQSVVTFVHMLNRSVVSASESAGLVSIRLFCSLLNEACETLMEGVSDIPDIDKTMKVGFGMRFGPFELADILGIDKIERYMENLYGEFGKVKYKPSPLIKKLSRAKRYGKDVGQGFYGYDENNVIVRENYFKL